MQEIGDVYREGTTKKLMDRMYQTALSACATEEQRAEVHPLTIEKLEDFGVLIRKGHDLVPTHAFALLTKPKDRHIKIQCALFKGTNRDEFIDRKEFDGAIQDQVEDAYQFVLKHINRSSVIDGLYRRDNYELPIQSIREMIANAVLHRSYLDSSSIQVSIYDDRVEVDSPGMLYDGLRVEEALTGKSKCRNKVIAEAFHYMKIIEGWGTGLPRLYSQCKAMNLPEPKFAEFGDGIKVTLYRKTGSEWVIGTTQSTQFPARSDEKYSLSDTEIKIINAMKANSSVSQSQLAKQLEMNVNAVKYYVRSLSKRNLIARRGNNRSGEWSVLI